MADPATPATRAAGTTCVLDPSLEALLAAARGEALALQVEIRANHLARLAREQGYTDFKALAAEVAYDAYAALLEVKRAQSLLSGITLPDACGSAKQDRALALIITAMDAIRAANAVVLNALGR